MQCMSTGLLSSWRSGFTAPRLVRLVCMLLEKQFEKQKFMFSCVRPQRLLHEIFRRQSDAPSLFNENADSEWASAPAQLLSVLVALHVFGYLEPKPGRTCHGTDNRSINFLPRKHSTTPLTLVNMQLFHSLMKAGVRISLAWRTRDKNTLADDLTYERFDKVDMDKRVGQCWM